MTPTSERRLARILLAGLLLWWGLAIAATAFAQEHLEVRFLDVGQADAVLLSHRGQVILYDAGAPLGSGDLHATQRRLRELGVDTVGLLVASHPHYDHIAGMPAVVDSLVVLAFASPGVAHDTDAYRRLADALDHQEQEAGWLYRVRPRQFADAGPVPWGDGLTIEWLAPPDSSSWEPNDLSVGLRVCLLDGCVLLAGDAEHEAWARWVEEYPQLLAPVAAHKASHHGSRNGDTAEALALLSPELVVISTGTGDRYGHPHPEALRLYEGVGARVLRTDTHGEVVVEVSASGEIRTWVERWPAPPPRRFWWWAPSSFGPMQ